MNLQEFQQQAPSSSLNVYFDSGSGQKHTGTLAASCPAVQNGPADSQCLGESVSGLNSEIKKQHPDFKIWPFTLRIILYISPSVNLILGLLRPT